MSPLVNPYLIAATFSSTILHCMILYVPFFNAVFSIAPLDFKEWGLVLLFAFPVIIIDEILKCIDRMKNASDLATRLKQD
jgi:magnesium-transporting ATPase (P-type)